MMAGASICGKLFSDMVGKPKHHGMRSHSNNQQALVIEFLQSLVLFGPSDTLSNFDSGDPNTPNFSQEGHGSIDPFVLFNNPTGPE